jgi:Outer membrane protein beta-barrel domain
MKLNFIAVVAFVLMTLSASAQVNFGIKGGLNFYNLKGDDIEADSKVGLHLGALAHIHLSETWAIQPELVFSGQGAEANGAGDDVKLALNYLNAPLLFQYMFDNGFRLEAGPQLGFLLSAKAKSDGNSTDVKDNFNSIDLSIPIGVGYILPSVLGFDARYNFGLSNVNEDDDSEIMNSGFQLGIFYQFQHD